MGWYFSVMLLVWFLAEVGGCVFVWEMMGAFREAGDCRCGGR